jgi:hypothetical protein
VLVLAGSGVIEVFARTGFSSLGRARSLVPVPVLLAVATGGLGAVAWVGFKVGALSYGGGFVIFPLMQHDAVLTYHWMSASQFLTAVALGQITPGPVVQTVAVVFHRWDAPSGNPFDAHLLCSCYVTLTTSSLNSAPSWSSTMTTTRSMRAAGSGCQSPSSETAAGHHVAPQGGTPSRRSRSLLVVGRRQLRADQ